MTMSGSDKSLPQIAIRQFPGSTPTHSSSRLYTSRIDTSPSDSNSYSPRSVRPGTGPSGTTVISVWPVVDGSDSQSHAVLRAHRGRAVEARRQGELLSPNNEDNRIRRLDSDRHVRSLSYEGCSAKRHERTRYAVLTAA